MQSLQYIGTKLDMSGDENINISDMQKYNLKLVYPYFDNETSLDPRFTAASEFGAIVLRAVDGDQAIKIAEKGIKNNPGDYRLYNHPGYVYRKSGNYKKAAEVYTKGAKIKDAPPFLSFMAASMHNEGGSRETARRIYRQMAKESTDKQTEENAEFKLIESDWLDERDAVNPILKNFETKNRRCVEGLREFVPFLQNIKLRENKEFHVDKNQNFVDPTDDAYILAKENCAVKLSAESKITKEEVPERR